MKEKKIFLIIAAVLASVYITACGGGTTKTENPISSEVSGTDAETVKAENVEAETPVTVVENLSDHITNAQNTDVSGVNEISDGTEETDGDAGSDNADDTGSDGSSENAGDTPPFDIIWLGDSLTQGSLGEDNKNENNPHAPWRVLGEISGLNVTGCGFYGHRACEIFWLYDKYNGVRDPRITYVYWVGSNDFFDSPDNIKNVIEEIDRFNENTGITKYLVLGTTNRGDMDPNAYIGINKVFEETYGDRYLDIMPFVEFGSDGVHLTEASYRKVAEAVWEKLRQDYFSYN